MKRICSLLLLCLLGAGALTLLAAAADNPAQPDTKNLIGEPRKLDTKYPAPFNVNLKEWFAAHPVPEGQKLRADVMFQTPRVVVVTITNKGQLFDLHYHTVQDEVVFLLKGKCKEYVDGKWIPFEAGQIHYNPRGVIHGTECSEEAQEVHFFTPPADDRIFLKDGKTTAKPGDVVGDWKLVDTQYLTNTNITLDQWYASHPIQAGKTMQIDAAMGTLRNQMMIAQKPQLGPHHHGSADEMIYVYKGVGEMYMNGKWVKIEAGTLHMCPRGFIHGIRPAGEEFKIFAVFTPPQANGSDRIFVAEK